MSTSETGVVTYSTAVMADHHSYALAAGWLDWWFIHTVFTRTCIDEWCILQLTLSCTFCTFVRGALRRMWDVWGALLLLLLSWQPPIGGSAASVNLFGPQTRVGLVQRVCADHKELCSNLH